MLELTAGIVTHNSDFTNLSNTVESYQRVKLNKQLIIHDNSSSESYKSNLKNLNFDKLISGPNNGYSFGHNRIFDSTPLAKYHLILNPDVVIPLGTLEAMIKYMDTHHEVGLLVPKILNPDGSLQMLNKRQPSVFNLFARRFLPKFVQNFPKIQKKMENYVMMDKGYESSYEVPYMSGCFMLFRREVFEKINGFDESFFMYLEDADITRRASEISKCVYFHEKSITHHWSRGSHKSLKLTWISVKSSFTYFNKWGWSLF